MATYTEPTQLKLNASCIRVSVLTYKRDKGLTWREEEGAGIANSYVIQSFVYLINFNTRLGTC
jgi:hypothetical protein